MPAAVNGPRSVANPHAVGSPVFEFTKRKKWADLLITELSGTVILVLSTNYEVLYCGAAAIELLGWREEEVIDTELSNWMHQDDVPPFRAHFDACVSSRTELATYARLRGKAGNEIHWPVFEFRGHPHYEADFECRCFFVMARPYPSRNTAMLDSFLELKIENERLRQRLLDLRPSTSTYSALPYSISNARGGGADVMFATDTLNGAKLAAGAAAGGQPDDAESVAGGSKPAAPLYVCRTCGRTDSPEWRKGPEGPKTLCNACGLRWAKRNQKKKQEGATANAAEDAGQNDGDEAAA
ncbi:GATA-domain-containing protein [Clavulina sp. PMI_390]|nr:GATA-domain-containing protein [Clavulina sp. PMI_390]